MISAGIATRGYYGYLISIATKGFFLTLLGEFEERIVIINLISEIKKTVDLESKVMEL